VIADLTMASRMSAEAFTTDVARSLRAASIARCASVIGRVRLLSPRSARRSLPGRGGACYKTSLLHQGAAYGRGSAFFPNRAGPIQLVGWPRARPGPGELTDQGAKMMLCYTTSWDLTTASP